MKKLLNYLPLHFLAALILGIVLEFYVGLWSYGMGYLWLVGLAFTALLFLAKKLALKQFFSIVSLAGFVFIGIATVFIQDDRNYKDYYEDYLNDDKVLVVKVFEVLKPGNFYNKYKAKIIQVDEFETRGKVLVNIKKDSTAQQLKVDAVIAFKAPLKRLIPPLNPHQFDYKSYLAKQGIHHQLFVNYKEVKNLNSNNSSLLGYSDKIRNVIQLSLKKHSFTQDEFGVINALLLGQRQTISKNLIDSYADAGAIHILAVSGLHVGIILLLLSSFLKPLEIYKKGKIIKLIVIVISLWVFALIAGLSASVVRAVTMFTFVAIGNVSNRKRNVYYSLITSMFFLLLIHPMFLFDVGFQLSYLAVFGIVWVQPKLYRLWKPTYKIIDKLWQLFTMSLAAQVGILPLSLYYFNQFPSLFLVSNLVIIPFLGGILMGGILVISLAVINFLPQFIAESYGCVITLMNDFVIWIAQQEKFLIENISISFLLMLVLYVLLFSIIIFFSKRTIKRLIAFLLAIILVQAVYLIEKDERERQQELIIFHKSRSTILGIRKGSELTVFHEQETAEIQKLKLLKVYEVGENVTVSFKNRIQDIYITNVDKLLIIDSLGVYQNLGLENPKVLLRNSPKINLKRLIDELNPKLIIADGSNYKSYINRWELTCKKEKTPFYYTGQNGAYIIK